MVITEIDLGMDPQLIEGLLSTALSLTEGVEVFARHFAKSMATSSLQALLAY